MRWLFWLLLVLALSIGVSLLAGSNQGYVLIVRSPYRLELSLNLLVILIVLSFVLLHFLLRFIHYSRRLPANVRAHKTAQRVRDGQTALKQALHAMSEGDYETAEKAASKALELGEDASISALTAARAAHKRKHRSQRDYYLAEAERLAPEASVARLLAHAELLLDDRQYSQALHLLQRLEKTAPRHGAGLVLQLKVQLRLGNWEQALVLSQQVQKLQAMESWQLREFRLQALQNMLQRYASEVDALLSFWQGIAEEDQQRLTRPAALAFIRAGDGDRAAELVEMALTREWDSDLAALLGDCLSTQPQKQLQQAEHWLSQHPDDAALLLSLGNMCLRLGLWGKAQSYLEASIAVQPKVAAHLALADLLQQQGQQALAHEHYQYSARLALQAG